MFNDELSTDQCKTLISRLAECAFPFQCAHGRPSMIPLMNLDLLDQQRSSDVDGNFQKSESFGRAFKRWRCKTPNTSGT
jgi:DNA mismatch repair protein MLH3